MELNFGALIVDIFFIRPAKESCSLHVSLLVTRNLLRFFGSFQGKASSHLDYDRTGSATQVLLRVFDGVISMGSIHNAFRVSKHISRA